MVEKIGGTGKLQYLQGIPVQEREKLKRSEGEVLDTENSETIRSMIEKAKEYPDYRSSLVESLKVAIENGTFEIDENKIASKIVTLLEG